MPDLDKSQSNVKIETPNDLLDLLNEYRNDYLTLSVFADQKQLDMATARRIIELARTLEAVMSVAEFTLRGNQNPHM